MYECLAGQRGLLQPHVYRLRYCSFLQLMKLMSRWANVVKLGGIKVEALEISCLKFFGEMERWGMQKLRKSSQSRARPLSF
jgi:hypothetical protein